jgi:hypothetical protein
MSRILLMESILGHMALLAERYPKKAASPVVKNCRKAVRQSLKLPTAAAQKPLRRAA